MAAGVLTLRTGIAFTVTLTVPVALQPKAEVPVTVYVVVALGVATGLAHVVQESAVLGDQE
jgi:hypothetical protein